MGSATVPYRWLRALKIKNLLIREFLAEFLATFVLILYGDAAFAVQVLEKEGISDVFAIVWAWGVAVILGVVTAGGITGGHINPAVTFAFATLGKLPWKKVGVYIIAQHIGAFLASAVLFGIYYDAINFKDNGIRMVSGENRTALIWATYPQDYVTTTTCFFDQIVGTGLLMFTALATIDTRNLNMPKWMHPIILGFMISATAMCFGLNCMAPLNPARDFATRAFTACAGYGIETFSYRNYNYWWVGVFGPHFGAIVGGWIYYLGIELHWPDPEDDKEKEMKEIVEGKNLNNR